MGGTKKGVGSTNAVAFFSQVGLTIIVCILAGVLAGRFLDEKLGTSPWILLLCSLLGLGAAFRAIFLLGGKK
ncbi:MAG: AtpZ/AtpI family protein [Oscillospiraceae bacterium]|nr:AtpZ/AtpI family protein [Oscillospiraceae bacterium]